MTPQRLTFHLTDRCQLNCDHCLRDPGAKPLDLDLELVESVLGQARELFGARHVGLTGGEPTLHPRFYEVIDAIVRHGYRWHVVTNAQDFERVLARLSERPERLERLEVFDFSLDGATEATHDGIRGEGSFRAVMRALLLCTARKLPFVLQITLHARNVHEIEEMALLASHVGAKTLAYNFTQPTGTFLDAKMALPAAEWRRAMDRIARVRDAFKIPVVHAEAAPHEAPLKLCEMWRHAMIHVDATGRLNLCCQHAGVPGDGSRSDVVGDLREMSLAEAYVRFTELVNDTVRARVEAIADGGLDEWDGHFSCNWCLKRFGKPHWVEDGVGGPDAGRPRWRGAWAPGYKPSHHEADPTLVPLRLVSGGSK